MPPCPHCRLDPKATPRIQDGVAASCLKTRNSPCVACQKLIHIEGRIEETRRSLEHLLAERNELASALNEHHDPFLTHLPVELASHIFTLSRPYQPSLDIFDLGFEAGKNNRGVLALGHVCRNWRNIAHRTPELWTIFGASSTWTSCATSLRLEMSLEWLKRCGGLPIFLSLYAGEPEYDELLHSTRTFVVSMAQHAYRCKALQLHLPTDVASIFSSAAAGKKLDQLEHLVLDLRDDGSNGLLELGASPRCLAVERGRLDHISIDWSKLTQFIGTYSEFTITECGYLLANATNLSRCSIGRICASADDAADQKITVDHSSLRTLQVGGFDTTKFWDHFNFPGLTTIRLDEGNDSLSWTCFRTCVRRSQCKIKDIFFVQDEKQNEDEILETLTLTSDVEKLGFQGSSLASRLLSVMIKFSLSGVPIQSNPGLLPQLKALVARSYATYTEFDWSSLVTFIVAFISMGKQTLQSVYIILENPLSLDCQDIDVYRTSFKELLDAAEGLELRVVDHEGLDLLGRLRRHYGL